ncbi:MAG: lytic transglycosylase domain-containing protein [Desulfovibrionaceae bacterium]|nr:lytic transglycosylase domain-containing protein [Desulfovibrionaceae bacterium]
MPLLLLTSCILPQVSLAEEDPKIAIEKTTSGDTELHGMYAHIAKPSTTKLNLAQREARYDQNFQWVGQHFGIPPNLLKAIARQESGCQPWIINIRGRDYYPRSKAEALELCEYAANANLSYDVGLMQINRYWIRKYQLPHSLLLDPFDNIYTGGFILAQEIKRSGLTWKAVGNYHSPTTWRALDYARKIRAHLFALLARQNS